MRKGVTVIVPAYNEEERLAGTLRSLFVWFSPGDVLVVDDGSTDGTASIAERLGTRVLRLERNRGKAQALAEGVAQTDTTYLLFVDADLGPSAWATARLLEPVIRGEADMVVAAWPDAGRRGGFGLVKGLARWWIWRLTGRWYSSPLSGQRALRREVWDAFRGSSGYGLEVALTVDALQAGLRVIEMPLILQHRHTGRGWQGFSHRGRQLIHIVRTVWERRYLR